MAFTTAQAKASLKIWQERETKARKAWHSAKKGTLARIKAYRDLRHAKWMVARRTKEVHKATGSTVRSRALHEARQLIGVMEQGGNNIGPIVTRIIRANGGTGPEPWCGDFVAYCYRAAGSKVVQRGWAATRLLGFLTGMKPVHTPEPGDIVVFNFSHTGIFVRRIDSDTIETIEGNTGRSGAVSDSSTGGDGVYEKMRQTNLVSRYVRVTR